MAEKKTSLISRIFTIVIALALGLFVFIPTFAINVKVDTLSGTETVFSTSVSVKDVLSVAFLSDEAKKDKREELFLKREEARGELILDGKTDKEADAELNSYSYSKEYALLKYFSNDTEDAVLGIATHTWLIIISVLEIAMLLALLLNILYSYMSMQYDNVSYPKTNKICALIAGVLGVIISLVTMICLKEDNAGLIATSAINVFGYIFMALSIYLPVHTALIFNGKKSYMQSKKK